MPKDSTVHPIWYIIGIIAVIAVGGFFLSGNQAQTPTCPNGYYYSNGVCNAVPTATPVATVVPGTTYVPASIVTPAAINTYHSATLTLKPTDAMGANIAASTMLFLNKQHARDIANQPMFDSTGKLISSLPYSEQNTRYAIMQIMSVYGTTSSGSGVLSYYSGERLNAPATGAFSQTLNGNLNDQLIAYTFVASGSTFQAPVQGINISTAKLITLSDWSDTNAAWSARMWDGSPVNWKIRIYPNATFTDDKGIVRRNYTVGDSGTVATKKQWNFYINATNVGEDPTTADIGIFLTAPKNLSTKSVSITLSPRYGNPITLTQDRSFMDSAGSVGVAASLLTGNVTTFNDELTYFGSIPSNWVTERTSSDRNQITGVLTADTYGTNVIGTLWLVQNVHAHTTTNGAIVNGNWFGIQFSSGGSSGYDTAP